MKNLTLKISNLSFAYTEKTVLKNINFELKSGEIIAILGKSGSGKSTIFRLLSGILPCPKDAKIEFFCQPNIAFMQQKPLLIEHFNALQNVALALILQGIKRKIAKENALNLLKNLGICHLAKKYPSSLSGGEAQRISLARTLICDYPICLLDEPFSALDYFSKHELMRLCKQKFHNKSAIFITHDIDDAIFLADRIFLLKDGELFPCKKDKNEILQFFNSQF